MSRHEGAIFLSRAGDDAQIAERIAERLRDAGYSVILQQWSFANRNFIERMHAALAGGARVLALVSPAYLRSQYCKAEWMNAIAGDPLNTNGRLVLLRIAECDPPGLLAGLAYWDAVPVLDDVTGLGELALKALGDDPAALAPQDRARYHFPAGTPSTAYAVLPVPSFTGRDDELAAIERGLQAGRTVVIEGLGGMGKSALAREYAWCNRTRYALVWLLHAETEAGIIQGLMQLGALFATGYQSITDRHAAANAVLDEVLKGYADPVLIVFDNVEDEELLRAWRPLVPAHVVATSRNNAWSGDVATVHVERWPLDDAAVYLRRESGRSDISADDARAVATVLGELPLALAHAAAYLKRMPLVSAEAYLRRIDEHLSQAPKGAE